MNWPTSTLEEVCIFIKNGKSIQQTREVDGLPITRIETIASQTIDDDRVGYAGLSEADAEGFLLQRGDILFSHINSLDHLGKTALYEGHPEKLVHGMNLLNLRPDGHKVDYRYLLHTLRAPETKAKLLRISNKSVNQASIAAGNLKKVAIPLPPIPEQRRIAAILDKADALRAKRRLAIAKLDQLLQSVFLEMFGDPVINPMGWRQKELWEICDPDDRVNYGVVQPGEDFPQGSPLIRVGDIEGGRVSFSSIKKISPEIEKSYGRSRLKGNELLVSCVGSIGTVAMVPEQAKGYNIARAITRVPLADPTKRQFVQECLRSPAIQRYFAEKTRTVSQPTLNVSFVKSAVVICPPESLITRFCQISEATEKKMQKSVISLDKLERLFLSLQCRAFSGN